MDTIQKTTEWFELAIPEPTSKNFSTQLGVHMEEFSEMLIELQPLTTETRILLEKAQQVVSDLAAHVKSHNDVIQVISDREQLFLDSLCDQVVTATGVAHMCNFDFKGAMTEVNASNFSKFDDEGKPIFNENMKIMKSSNYFQPDLSKYLTK